MRRRGTWFLCFLLFGCAKGEGNDGSGGFGGLPAYGEDGEDEDVDDGDGDADGDDDAGADQGQDGDDGAPQPEPNPQPEPDPEPDPEPPVGAGDCCEPQPTPGCGDEAVTTCVCEADVWCCENEWDDVCIGLVTSEGCGDCGEPPPEDPPEDPPMDPPMDPPPMDPPEPPEPPVGDSPCCTAQPGPGCALDPALEACVCGADPFCCDVLWDDACLETAHLVCEQCC